MNATEFRYGFRTDGRDAERRLTDWQAAFVAHVQADPRAMTPGECYLSAFQFAEGFREHLQTTGSVRGYSGPTWAQWLWFDIDAEGDLQAALTHAQRLVAGLELRLGIDPEQLLAFFSGSKGFHVGLPTGLFNAEPAAEFHTVCRAVAVQLAEDLQVQIDQSVYSRVNLFRAPNSRHRKTGLFKVRLQAGELLWAKPDGILQLAQAPRESELPNPADAAPAAVELWQQAHHEAEQLRADTAERRAQRTGKTRLNPTTRAFITEGSAVGDRHRELFSAAADLAEFDSMQTLIQALLTEPGLHSGLSAADVARQIACGIQHGGRRNGK